ncbi:MAG: hypothetical protein ABIH23_25825 [bacterium]
MPWEWSEPEEFLTHRGVRISHAYKDDLSDIPLEFWYSTSSTAEPGSTYEFDVRDLAGYRSRSRADEFLEHERLIKAAIDAGLLRPDTPARLNSHA